MLTADDRRRDVSSPSQNFDKQAPRAFIVLTCSPSEAKAKWPLYGWFLQINDMNVELPASAVPLQVMHTQASSQDGTIEKTHRSLVTSHLRTKNSIRLIRMIGTTLPDDVMYVGSLSLTHCLIKNTQAVC